MSDALKPPIHGRDHRPGGEDPIPGLENSYCYMRWVGTEAVPVNTLTEPSSLADYEEGFVVDQDAADFSVDLSTGIIRWGNPGEYLITCHAEFGGGATPGSKLECILDVGNGGSFSTFRIGNHIIADTINENFLIPVVWNEYSFNPGVFGHDSVRVLVDHNDAGGLSLGRVDIHVVRLSPRVSGTFSP